MNYQGVLDYLKEIESKGIQPGLENIRQILHHSPFFHKDTTPFTKKACFIQVAGTNGKGSTAHFLESILQASGYTVGLFTSPHLTEILERIAVNKEWIPEKDFIVSFQDVKELSTGLLNRKIIHRMPSYFEFTFLIALHYFIKKDVDIVILEVGLGGRWDATTAITPAISVITTIAKDHTSLLGAYLKNIAEEKAGIIKKGVPVICGCQAGTTAHRVIKNIAIANSAPFFNVTDKRNHLDIKENHNSYRCLYKTNAGDYRFSFNLNGKHQGFNAAVAIKTIEVLKNDGFCSSVTQISIDNGISQTSIPGRIETLDTSPPTILDGGHNVQSITALVQFLKDRNKNNLTLVFGMLADKNYKKIISLLMPFAANIILTKPLSPRALPPQKIVRYLNGKPVHILSDLHEAYSAARQFNGDILITGSFYLVGAMRKIILAGG